MVKMRNNLSKQQEQLRGLRNKLAILNSLRWNELVMRQF